MERLSLIDIGRFLAKQANMSEFRNGIKDAAKLEDLLYQIRREIENKYHVIYHRSITLPGTFGQGRVSYIRKVEGAHTTEEERKIFDDYGQEYRRRKAEVIVDEAIGNRDFKYKAGFFIGRFFGGKEI